MAAENPLKLPPDDDLRRLIHFSAGDGRIWLAGHRMVLLHLGGLANLRKELMQQALQNGEKDALRTTIDRVRAAYVRAAEGLFLIPAAGLTPSELFQALRGAGVDEATAKRIGDALERLDSMRYGRTAAEPQSALGEARSALEALLAAGRRLRR